MWLGVMVLLAHLVDISEWIIILAAPEYFDQRFVTNSPLVTATLVGAVWIVMALGVRLRRPWPYALIALAVFSHLLLDWHPARIALVDTYHHSTEAQIPSRFEAVIAEIWLYGLLLVLVGLVQAARQRDCPTSGRAAAGILGALAIFAAISRSPFLWTPAYGLALLHTLLLFRREVNVRLLWSLVPLLPLIALLSVELWAGHIYKQAEALRKSKEYAAAITVYQRALAVPTRSQNLSAYLRLSRCQQRLGDFTAAEATLLHAIRVCDNPYWLHCRLAALYTDPDVQETPFFRPDEAGKILQDVIDSPCRAVIRNHARKKLERLRRQGLIE